MGAPSGLPLFADIRKAVLRGLGINLTQFRESSVLDLVAPEALLKMLHDNGVNVAGLMTRWLSGGTPNAIHHAVAGLLKAGAVAWTTNTDELVETILGDGSRYVACWREDCVPDNLWEARLLKPHGTCSTGQFAFRSDQVLIPLKDAWRDRLLTDAKDSKIALIGYAGADTDIKPILREAFERCVEAVWFELPGDNSDLLHRRYKRAISASHLTIIPTHNPGISFLQWLKDTGFEDVVNAVPSKLKVLLEKKLQAPCLTDGGELRHLDGVAAHLLSDFGLRTEARRKALLALFKGPSTQRRRVVELLWRQGLRRRSWWALAIRLLLVVWTYLPNMPCKERAFKDIYTLGQGDGKPHRLRKIAERARKMLGDAPGLLLNSAASARMAGNLAAATKLSQCAAKVAEEQRVPQAYARALFEQAFTARWQGRFNDAAKKVEEYEDGYAQMGGAQWPGWASFELGCQDTLKARLIDAKQHFEDAVERFAGGRSSQGLVASHMAFVHVALLEGDGDEAQKALKKAEIIWREVSGDRYHYKEFDLLRGELARFFEIFTEAEDAYKRLAASPYPMQRALGLFGLGEVQRLTGRPPVCARHALQIFRFMPCSWGQARALVTLALAGCLSESDAISEIEDLGYEGKRTDHTGVLKYCIGARPEINLVAFP